MNSIQKEKNFGCRKIFVQFLNLLLLKSYKTVREDITFNIHSKVLLGSRVIAQF